jgi:inhibitor of KinA
MTTAHDLDIVRIAAAGDSALLIEFDQAIDPRINARAIALADRLRRRCGTAVRDAVVGYATLTLYFDPLVVDGAWMEAEVRDSAASMDDILVAAGAEVDVPVCYGGEFGPDIANVAAFGGCTEEEVIALHAGTLYRVYMVGFIPGFAYLAEVDPRIAAPRRVSPRIAVPPGSVAIAGGQTGIYPAVTPGGWNIIGRTPLKPFDPERRSPFLLQPGDTVKFRSVSRDEYEGIH